MWIVYGWDSTIQQTVGGPQFYGYGHHWSTILSFAFMLYLSFVNLGIGGIRSFKQLRSEMMRDLITIRHYFHNENKYRNAYPDPVVKTHTLFAYSTLMVVGIFFIFESIWVLLYNLGNFKDYLWPVYWTGGLPFQNYVTMRNFGLSIIGIGMGILAVVYPSIRLQSWDFKGAIAKYSWKNRGFNNKFTIGILLVILSFTFWFYYPIPHKIVTWDDLPNYLVTSANVEGTEKEPMTDNPEDYVFPTQTHFPQTSYTFYETRYYMKVFSLKDIRGFYIDDPLIHSVNVICKSLTLGVLLYPALIFVRRNDS